MYVHTLAIMLWYELYACLNICWSSQSLYLRDLFWVTPCQFWHQSLNVKADCFFVNSAKSRYSNLPHFHYILHDNRNWRWSSLPFSPSRPPSLRLAPLVSTHPARSTRLSTPVRSARTVLRSLLSSVILPLFAEEPFLDGRLTTTLLTRTHWLLSLAHLLLAGLLEIFSPRYVRFFGHAHR